MSNQADKQLDELIARALAIEVPELAMPELADVDADKVTAIVPRRQLSAPTWFALAATVAIAAILGVRMLGIGVEYASLADEVIAHLDHEPRALRVTTDAVSEERLHKVVPANVAELDHSAGLITYAQTCIINGRRVPHLVIQGKRGPVTILLMPEEKLSAATDISGESINGVILPVGNGSIAIIGEREERLDDIRKEILNSVAWTT